MKLKIKGLQRLALDNVVRELDHLEQTSLFFVSQASHSPTGSLTKKHCATWDETLANPQVAR